MLNFKYYKTSGLILTIIILSILFDSIFKFLMPILKDYGIEYLRAPGNISLIIIVLTIYNKYLWKFPVFKLLVKVPNMAGRYKGKVKYNFQGKDDEKDCIIEVNQTASRIKIYSYFNNKLNEKTDSKSLVEDISLEENGFFDIFLYYLNNGNKINSVLDCHEGANKLRYIPKTKTTKAKLTGHYFTNRQIPTKGEIYAEFESNKLKGEY